MHVITKFDHASNGTHDVIFSEEFETNVSLNLEIGTKDEMIKNICDVMLDINQDASYDILSSIDEVLNQIVSL